MNYKKIAIEMGTKIMEERGESFYPESDADDVELIELALKEAAAEAYLDAAKTISNRAPHEGAYDGLCSILFAKAASLRGGRNEHGI